MVQGASPSNSVLPTGRRGLVARQCVPIHVSISNCLLSTPYAPTLANLASAFAAI